MAERNAKREQAREERTPVPGNAGLSFQALRDEMGPPPGGHSFQALQGELGPPPSAAGAGGFDFQSLREELGSLPREATPAMEDPRDSRYAGADGLDEVPDPEIERKLAAMLGEDEHAARVLTGGAPKSRPMWVGGTILSVFALFLCWFFLSTGGYRSSQPFVSYTIMVVALGAMVWSYSGMRNEKESEQQRKLNWIGMILGLIAAIVAFLQRSPHAN